MKKIFFLTLILLLSVFVAGCTHVATKTDQNGSMQNENIQQDQTENEEMREPENEKMTEEETRMKDDANKQNTVIETDTMMLEEGREITVDSSNFKFSKDVIKVKAGETITLKLTNSEGFHDFVIDELNVKTKQIKMGETDTVTFKVPEIASGEEYEFYCSVGQHRQMGMVGTLMVE